MNNNNTNNNGNNNMMVITFYIQANPYHRLVSLLQKCLYAAHERYIKTQIQKCTACVLVVSFLLMTALLTYYQVTPPYLLRLSESRTRSGNFTVVPTLQDLPLSILVFTITYVLKFLS